MSGIKKDDKGVITIETPTSRISHDPNTGVTVFVDYNVDKCKEGQPHKWDGPEVEDNWGGSGVSCSVCGVAYGDWAMQNLP